MMMNNIDSVQGKKKKKTLLAYIYSPVLVATWKHCSRICGDDDDDDDINMKRSHSSTRTVDF